jgi:hypothetical protein
VSISWHDVERTLCRIPEVTRARVVSDAHDAVLEVHIVAISGKHPKQIVRDVQSVAMASFGVRVDRHVVSVVQLDEDADSAGEQTQPPAESRERIRLAGMTLQSQQGTSSVSVVLERAGQEATGSCNRTAAGLHRLAAEAAMDALGCLHPGLAGELDAVDVRHVGTRRVAVVSVAQRLAHGDELLVGTAGVRAAGEADAVARAVLDALNRRLSR